MSAPETTSHAEDPLAPAPVAGSPRRRAAWALAGALVAVCVVWRRIVFLDETNVLRDALTFTLPAYDAIVSALRAGRLPQWFDAAGTGAALAANPIHSALYPVAWLLLPIPRIGPDLFTLVHVVIGGLGAGLWAARLGADHRGAGLAAATYAASGYVVSVVPNGMAPVVAWIPWVAWAADRLASAEDRRARIRAACVLAVAWAFQLAAGEPGHAIASGWLMIAVILGRSGVRGWRMLGWAAASVAGALALAAAIALPALALLRISDRGRGLDPVIGGLWSMHPIRILELVWPGLLGRPLEANHSLYAVLRDVLPGTESLGPAWAMSVHLGAAPLLLATLGSRERTRLVLLVASALFVLLALGTHLPTYEAYRTVFLPERVVRFPEKYLAGAVAIWSALAGAGLTRASRAPSPAWATRLGGAATVVLLLTAAFLVRSAQVGAEISRILIGLDADGTAEAIASGGAVLACSLATLAAAASLARRARREAATVLAAAAVLVPLAWDDSHSLMTGTRDRVAARPPVLETIRRADPTARLGPVGVRIYRGWEPVSVASAWGEMAAAFRMETVSGNIATRFGFGVLPGLDSAATATAERFAAAMAHLDGIAYSKLLAVPWALVWAAPDRSLPRAPAISLGKGWHLLHVPEARPRAFVAPRWRTARPGWAAIDDLATPERTRDLGLVAVEGMAPSPPENDDEPMFPCRIDAPAPEDVRLHCLSRAGGVAVLLDELAPGWTATLDGAPAEIRRVDGFFRGVPIGPGSHEVVFRYRTPGLRVGFIVSIAAWGALAGIAFVTRKRAERA